MAPDGRSDDVYPPRDWTRRHMLQALAALATTSWWDLDTALAAAGPTLGAPEPFDFDRLRERARRLAGRPHRSPPEPYPKLLDAIDYDTYQKIRFRRSNALWGDEAGTMPVELFHLNRYARKPVAIHVVREGEARRVRYAPSLFDYGSAKRAQRLAEDLGFAGFRVLHPGDRQGDWLAFMGASYFRSAGALDQYGLSARGVAVDTALPDRKEQFPRFTSLWLQQPKDSHRIVVHALLEGISLTGAYRFDCCKGEGVLVDVHAELFQREDIARLGLAPLTSMYWYSETNHRRGSDWRPEVHDSDGLAMWSGAGERIWRPLNAPPHPRTSTFVDHDPKGFGLLQRDRDFDHYQDDGVFYDRRPSVWVEPKGEWGAGAVHLVELPTDDEIHDNIVAFWVPQKPASAGTGWKVDYRVHWVATEPCVPAVGRVVATRLGRAGIPGQHEKRPPHGRKIVIDFRGGPLAELEQRYDLEVVVQASRGTIQNRHALKVVGTDRWRGSFDLLVEGSQPVDLRCYLRLGERTLTETWMYQFLPDTYGVAP